MATLPANTNVAQLPNQIPPQSAPVLIDGGNGNQVFETNWWLFFYNIASQVISLAGGAVTLPASVNIALIDSDVVDSDSVQAPRQIANTTLLIPDMDIGPSLRDMANAMLLATDSLLQDSPARAQPVAPVTVGASPFTFTAAANGTLAISVGTVSSVSIVRQGVTVATGLTDGLVPVSRSDQVVITYVGLPTVVFVPS